MDLRCMFLIKEVIEINYFGCFMLCVIKYIILELASIMVQDLSIVCLCNYFLFETNYFM
jgi:hypothetical protein